MTNDTFDFEEDVRDWAIEHLPVVPMLRMLTDWGAERIRTIPLTDEQRAALLYALVQFEAAINEAPNAE